MSPGQANVLVLRRHLVALDGALHRLERHAAVSLVAYLADLDLQWTVERGLLVCVQNVLDIATHVSASAGVDSPDYTASIDALARLGVLLRELAQRLRPLAGFRNVLVHAYLTLDPVRVLTGRKVRRDPPARRGPRVRKVPRHRSRSSGSSSPVRSSEVRCSRAQARAPRPPSPRAQARM